MRARRGPIRGRAMAAEATAPSRAGAGSDRIRRSLTRFRNITAELGSEIAWAGRSTARVKTLDLAVFRYWTPIVETSLKDAGGATTSAGWRTRTRQRRKRSMPGPRSTMAPKGSPGSQRPLQPAGAYGDVLNECLRRKTSWSSSRRRSGLSSTRTACATACAPDNAGKVPRVPGGAPGPLGALTANGCPNEYPHQLFGDEGFPFPSTTAVRRGRKASVGEFTMQQLLAGRAGCLPAVQALRGVSSATRTAARAAGAQYPFSRPARRLPHHAGSCAYVPLSRAVQRAGRVDTGRLAPAGGQGEARRGGCGRARTNAEESGGNRARAGEPAAVAGRSRATPAGGEPLRRRRRGLYLYVDAAGAEEIMCERRAQAGPPRGHGSSSMSSRSTCSRASTAAAHLPPTSAGHVPARRQHSSAASSRGSRRACRSSSGSERWTGAFHSCTGPGRVLPGAGRQHGRAPARSA